MDIHLYTEEDKCIFDFWVDCLFKQPGKNY